MGALFNAKYETWMNERALEKFSEGKSITAVCNALGICRETYANWRDNKDHPFYLVAKHGEQISQEHWEDIGKDGIVGNLEKFAGSSWQFIMKNRFRESYVDAPKEDNSAQNTLIEKLLEKL